MRGTKVNIDLEYQPFEVADQNGTVHKLRYYVENGFLHLAGTFKKAILHKDAQGAELDPEGLARLLAKEWLKEQVGRSKPKKAD